MAWAEKALKHSHCPKSLLSTACRRRRRRRGTRTGFRLNAWDQHKSNQSSCNARTKSDLAPSEVALSLNQERALAGMYGALFLPCVGTNVPKPCPRRARVMRLTFRILLHQLPKVQTSDFRQFSSVTKWRRNEGMCSGSKGQ